MGYCGYTYMIGEDAGQIKTLVIILNIKLIISRIRVFCLAIKMQVQTFNPTEDLGVRTSTSS